MENIQTLACNFIKLRNDYSFKKLITRLEPGIKKYIFDIIKDRELTNDVYVETITKVYQKIDTYNDHYSFSTWVYRIARNGALMLLNDKHKNVCSLNSMMEDYDFQVPNDEVSAEESMRYEILEENKKMFLFDDEEMKKDSAISSILSDMPDIYSEILTDYEMGDLSYQEIADKYDISLSAVKLRIMRGRTMLRKKLGIEK